MMGCVIQSKKICSYEYWSIFDDVLITNCKMIKLTKALAIVYNTYKKKFKYVYVSLPSKFGIQTEIA